MKIDLEFWPTLTVALVMISWFGFVTVFILRKKPEQPPDRRRDRGSLVGVLLQGAAYVIVWVWRRHQFSAIAPVRAQIEIALAILTGALAIASVVMCLAAVRALGKEWSVTARVVEGHNLITSGPYQLVRNPIYTGMLGMLLATGLAISRWAALLIGIVVFAIGTFIRVRSEEKLLREAFGAKFDDYARRVPAVVPYLF